MYCKKCGAQNQDTAKFCCKCGEPLSKPAAPVQPPQNSFAPPPAAPFGQPGNDYSAPQAPQYSAPQNNSSAPPPTAPYGAPDPYAPPQNAYAPPAGGYGGSSGSGQSFFSKVGITFWISIVLLLVTFVGFFTPWVKGKVSMSAEYNGKSRSETFFDSDSTYYKILKGDDDTTDIEKDPGVPKKVYDKIDSARTDHKLMKWIGLAGFIVVLGAVICGFINRKLMAFVAAAGTILLAVAMLFDILCMSNISSAFKEIMDVAMAEFSYRGATASYKTSASISYGVIIAVAASAAGTVFAFIEAFRKKENSSAAPAAPVYPNF